MKILSAAEMRECDRVTQERFDVSSTELMRQAAQAVTRFVQRRFPRAQRVTVLCGRGNNGGDGLMAARLLSKRACDVTVILLGEPETLKGDAAIAWQELVEEKAGTRIRAESDHVTDPESDAPHDIEHESRSQPSLRSRSSRAIRSGSRIWYAVTTPEQLADHAEALSESDLILDAVLGTGFKPPLRDLALATLELLRAQKTLPPVVAIDLPSGWDADSIDATSSDAFPADAVITFTAPKPAHLFGQLTRSIRQPIVVAPIGSPDEAIVSQLNQFWAGSAKKITDTERPANSNKGMYGHVLVIGGSPGKSGAPAMASLSAMRTGAGLVTAAVTPSVLPLVASIAPELMTTALEVKEQGEISKENLEPKKVEALLKGIKVLAIGPGLGMTPEASEFAIGLLTQSRLPAVADADALNAIAAKPEILPELVKDRTLVLTPHPGEMARLIGKTIKDVEADRIGIAREFATRNGVILVLKGWRTLIAHPDGSIAINTTGNPGMAKGGSGDLLTGMVAAMLSQHPDQPGKAVEAAVYLHGLAADITVASKGIGGDQHTLLATDSLANLHLAFQYDPRDWYGCTWVQGSR
jgi:NAD(P)H-hydrate epimerase